MVHESNAYIQLYDKMNGNLSKYSLVVVKLLYWAYSNGYRPLDCDPKFKNNTMLRLNLGIKKTFCTCTKFNRFPCLTNRTIKESSKLWQSIFLFPFFERGHIARQSWENMFCVLQNRWKKKSMRMLHITYSEIADSEPKYQYPLTFILI